MFHFMFVHYYFSSVWVAGRSKAVVLMWSLFAVLVPEFR